LALEVKTALAENSLGHTGGGKPAGHGFPRPSAHPEGSRGKIWDPARQKNHPRVRIPRFRTRMRKRYSTPGRGHVVKTRGWARGRAYSLSYPPHTKRAQRGGGTHKPLGILALPRFRETSPQRIFFWKESAGGNEPGHRNRPATKLARPARQCGASGKSGTWLRQNVLIWAGRTRCLPALYGRWRGKFPMFPPDNVFEERGKKNGGGQSRNGPDGPTLPSGGSWGTRGLSGAEGAVFTQTVVPAYSGRGGRKVWAFKHPVPCGGCLFGGT